MSFNLITYRPGWVFDKWWLLWDVMRIVKVMQLVNSALVAVAVFPSQLDTRLGLSLETSRTLIDFDLRNFVPSCSRDTERLILARKSLSLQSPFDDWFFIVMMRCISSGETHLWDLMSFSSVVDGVTIVFWSTCSLLGVLVMMLWMCSRQVIDCISHN
jgi:hypothetical protein